MTLPPFDPSAHPVPQDRLERLQAFAERWQGKVGQERDLAQGFLLELCRALGTASPFDDALPPEDYKFEKVVDVPGTTEKGRIDLYKKGHFVLEAKCGRNSAAEPGTMPIRGTRKHHQYIEAAYNDQARLYASALPEGRPPLLVVVDVGYKFWIWRRNPDGNYPGFQSPEVLHIPLDAVADEENARILWSLFEHPADLDPARRQAKVTEEVAAVLAQLAAPLQRRYAPNDVAGFLIRCLFCLFAEDVELLPNGHFSTILNRASARPDAFRPSVEQLFTAMRDGGWFNMAEIRRFNGALFADPRALDLTRDEVKLLADAGSKNWALVEPSIFGTLIERALDPKKRKRLGAHYTPRAFVERLVRPTIEQPLRRTWELAVRPEVQRLADEAEAAENERRAITATDLESRERAKALSAQARKALDTALAALDDFHGELIRLRVLDPACGTGNFLYVSYALVKELEYEVLALRAQVDPHDTQLGLAGGATGIGAVSPSQFLGIEIEGFAAEIAQLVLWIGHLQWELRHRVKPEHVPEPIVPTVRTIEHRDALLVPGPGVPRLDAQGQPVTRWIWGAYVDADTHDGQVPDPTAREPVVDYPEATEATWPRADFIVGNPPFIGNKVMRDRLGDGYVDALRRVYREVPDTVDFVMYWWHKAAEKARAGEVRRFGFITTNSIRQTFNRKVLELHMQAETPVRLVMAVPDHPWVDDGAAVRISMTAAEARRDAANDGAIYLEVVEDAGPAEDLTIKVSRKTAVNADLRTGADPTTAKPLASNQEVSFQGVNVVGTGFRLSRVDMHALGFAPDAPPPIVRPYINARDMMQKADEKLIIDAFGLGEAELRALYPTLHQWLSDRVLPERLLNNREAYRKFWWLFAEVRHGLRQATKGLRRTIITPRTAKHRVFRFLEDGTVPDCKLIVIALDDDASFGILQSHVHEVWSLATAGWQGVGNDPVYDNGRCFVAFPFPNPTPAQRERIATIARDLHAFRDAAQARAPELTLTTMYNLVAARRAHDKLDAKQQRLHTLLATDALVALHDALDAAVAEAYGWPADLTDEQILERLVALNHARAEEEARGLVRWLRPDRARAGAVGGAQLGLADKADEALPPWPKDKGEQVMRVFAVVDGAPGPLDVEAIAARFQGARRQRVAEIVGQLETMRFVVRDGGGAVRSARG